MKMRIKDILKAKAEKKARKVFLAGLDKECKEELMKRVHQRMLMTGETLEESFDHFRNYLFS